MKILKYRILLLLIIIIFPLLDREVLILQEVKETMPEIKTKLYVTFLLLNDRSML